MMGGVFGVLRVMLLYVAGRAFFFLLLAGRTCPGDLTRDKQRSACLVFVADCLAAFLALH